MRILPSEKKMSSSIPSWISTCLSGLVYLFFTSTNTLVTKALKEVRIPNDNNDGIVSGIHMPTTTTSTHKFSHDIIFVNIMVFGESLLAVYFVIVYFNFTPNERERAGQSGSTGSQHTSGDEQDEDRHSQPSREQRAEHVLKAGGSGTTRDKILDDAQVAICIHDDHPTYNPEVKQLNFKKNEKERTTSLELAEIVQHLGDTDADERLPRSMSSSCKEDEEDEEVLTTSFESETSTSSSQEETRRFSQHKAGGRPTKSLQGGSSSTSRARSPFEPLGLLPFCLSGLLDWVSSLLQVVGQGYIAASAYQMLKTSRLLFVFFISLLFVKMRIFSEDPRKTLTPRQLKRQHWGLVLVFLGVLSVSWGTITLESKNKSTSSKIKTSILPAPPAETSATRNTGAVMSHKATTGAGAGGVTTLPENIPAVSQELQTEEVDGFGTREEGGIDLDTVIQPKILTSSVDGERETKQEEQEEEQDASTSPQEEQFDFARAAEVLTGISLVTVGVFCSALRLALQEAFLKKNPHVPPTFAVGVEGMFGLVIGLLVVLVLNTPTGRASASESPSTTSTSGTGEQDIARSADHHMPSSSSSPSTSIRPATPRSTVSMSVDTQHTPQEHQLQQQRQHLPAVHVGQFFRDLGNSKGAQILVIAILFVAMGHNFYGAVFAKKTSSSARTILASVATLFIFNVENGFCEMIGQDWGLPDLSVKYDFWKGHFWFLLLGYLLALGGTGAYFQLF
ncbi:unnamed protein product [Amoebophrya sp. A25]|nr:unnamed protein product [Amoebophrya sp. A25]|eukprot:GSA25T00020401001.1